MVADVESMGASREARALGDNHSRRHRGRVARIEGEQLVRFLKTWTGTWLVFLAVAMWWALQSLPTSGYYFRASSMVVPDVPVSADVV